MLNNIKEGQKVKHQPTKNIQTQHDIQNPLWPDFLCVCPPVLPNYSKFLELFYQPGQPLPPSTWEMLIYCLSSQLSSVPLRRFPWPSLGNVNCSHLNELISPIKCIITCFLTSSFTYEFPEVRNYILFIFVSLVPSKQPST